MSKVLVVLGATGQQGGSVVDFVLNDTELSREYRIRAITRDVNSTKARQLSAKKVEVVQGDVTDPVSIEKALAGSHTVFIMTNAHFEPDGAEVEFEEGKRIADAAVASGAQYIIFSTLPSAKELSGGKYTKVIHFEGKARAEKYIRSLNVKSAFYCPGYFLQNLINFPFQAPEKEKDGSYTMTRLSLPNQKQPLIDIVADTGKFIGAILAQPDKYEGKTFYSGSTYQTWEDLAAVIAKTTGKNVVFKTTTEKEFYDSMPFAKDDFTESFMCIAEFGWYGPDTEEKVRWSAENARGKLTTLEEFFKANPLELA
nr:nmra-like family domain-containing protein 1 [Quercus suber]